MENPEIDMLIESEPARLPPLPAPVLPAAKNPVVLFLARLSKNSRKTMTYILQDCADRLGFDDVPIYEVPWMDMQPGHLTALLSVLREDGLAPKYAALFVSAIRGVFSEGFINGLIDGDRLARMRAVKSYVGKRLPKGKHLKQNLIREMLAICDADERPQGLRDAAILSILYGSGMRKAESVRFEISDIDYDEGTIRVLGKNNKEMLKFVPDWALMRVKKWLEFRDAQKPGFQFLFNRIHKGGGLSEKPLSLDGVYYVVTQRGREVGVKITPHDFRRSFITRIIEEHDLSIAQKMADHSNIATTAGYDMRDDSKKRAVSKAFDI